MTYPISDEDRAYLERTFTYHTPKEDQAPRYQVLRAEAAELAQTILSYCPPSRERTIALRELEQAIMWANASIARNE